MASTIQLYIENNGLELASSAEKLVDEKPGWVGKALVFVVVVIYAYRSWPPLRTEWDDSSVKGR